MNDCANEKEILHFLFFNQESSKIQILPPQFPRLPQYTASTCGYNAYSQSYDPHMQFQLTHMTALGIKPLKKKGKMQVECPHKDKRHYAKVYALPEYVHQLLSQVRQGQEGVALPTHRESALRPWEMPELLSIRLPSGT